MGRSLHRTVTRLQDTRGDICGLRSWLAQTVSCIFVKKVFEGVRLEITSTVGAL